MTLIIGIRCKDGTVVGSDSAVTFVSGQNQTIEQHSRQKIDIIDKHIIVAGTGEVGLGQRFRDTIEKKWKDKVFLDKNIVDIGCMLSSAAIKNFFSTHINTQTINYGALVAIPCKDTAELIEFSVNTFQPEVKTDKDIWYASMGSGQSVADPLLGFIRKTFWGNDPPNRQEGIFAATMVLKLGCEMAPGGVAGPIQMAVLSSDRSSKGKLYARRLEEVELSEHEENVEAAIEYFKKYRDILHEKPTQELPKPSS